MTEPLPTYETDQTESLAWEPSRYDDEFWGKLFRVLHRMLVTADDFLCAEFNFSRRARGKWARHELERNA